MGWWFLLPCAFLVFNAVSTPWPAIPPPGIALTPTCSKRAQRGARFVGGVGLGSRR